MKRLWAIGLGAIALGLSSGAARAIIVEDPAVATNAPDAGPDWNFIYSYKRATAVTVAPNWVLTAAHVAFGTVASSQSNIVVNGTNYFPREIIYHSPVDDPNGRPKADLALVRFDKTFPGKYPLYTGTFPTLPPSSKLSVFVIGFGNTGTVGSTYWIDAGSGRGTRRWGSQRIDSVDTQRAYEITVPAYGWTTNRGVWMNFLLGDTPREAGTGLYDSGAGVFTLHSGEWKLAALVATRSAVAGSNNTYNSTFALDIPSYAAWIDRVTNPVADLDGDGIPNGWEQQYGSTTGLVATADNDLDGYSNSAEYEADTNPLVAASRPEVTGWNAAGDLTFFFNGSTGRVYQVLYTTNALTDSPLTWMPAQNPAVPGTGNPSSITITPAEGARFFRLKITFPP
jgi:hypothetical protein